MNGCVLEKEHSFLGEVWSFFPQNVFTSFHPSLVAADQGDRVISSFLLVGLRQSSLWACATIVMSLLRSINKYFKVGPSWDLTVFILVTLSFFSPLTGKWI